MWRVWDPRVCAQEKYAGAKGDMAGARGEVEMAEYLTYRTRNVDKQWIFTSCSLLEPVVEPRHTADHFFAKVVWC